MIIILRGHIRNSLDNEELYNFINELSKKYNIQIYIHTWNIKQNNISWRKIENDFTKITEEMIQQYFKDHYSKIKKIIIEDEQNILLIGNLEGKILSTKTNVLGWKRYIYGQHKILNFLYDNLSKSEFVINTRFDLFCNSFIFPFDEIINFINNTYDKKYEKNEFMKNSEYCGLDNIIVGNVETQYHLFSFLYFHLDNFCKNPMNTHLIHPEFLVYRANQLLL